MKSVNEVNCRPDVATLNSAPDPGMVELDSRSEQSLQQFRRTFLLPCISLNTNIQSGQGGFETLALRGLNGWGRWDEPLSPEMS